jgi:hypothetical protein
MCAASNFLHSDNPGPAHDGVVGLYPLHSGMFRHGLTDHPLLKLEALADAATVMQPAHVEYRSSASAGFEHLVKESTSIADVIRNIASHDCWVMLRFIEQLPAYQALLEETLNGFAQTVEPHTGLMRDLHAFVFISTNQVITPFHCDPEYNILFHIAGQKSFMTLPAKPPFLDEDAHQRLHVGGDNLLIWDEAYREHATDNQLGPGDALYVPYKTPHIVSVSGGPSISISMTWKSDWSFAQDRAHRFNIALRQLGMKPRPVPQWPARTPLLSGGGRLLQKIGLPK